MCRVWFIALMVLCGLKVNAQSNKVNESLSNNFTSYHLTDIDITAQFRLSNHSLNDVEMTIPSPSGEGNIQLELFKTSVFAEGYVRTIYNEDSIVTNHGMELIIMDGRIKKRAETRVYVVTGDNYFFAYVDDGHEKFYYEPISFYGGEIESNLVVIYNEKDVKSTDSYCGSNIYHKNQNGKRNHSTTRTGQCYEVEYAVVSDFRMYQDFGNSVSQVEAFVASITGLMNGDYDTSFDDELIHVLVQNVVSTSQAGDEWLQNGDPASIDELLDEFSDWGPSNLVSHDVASLWSGYNLSGNTIGLAWLGVVCQSYRYNVLEHYTSNMTQLRVLNSHELGHNYNATHDGGGGFIMSPSVNNTSTWSPQSIDAINAFYGPRAPSCFDSCGGGGSNAPTADFTYTINESCAPGSVAYFDASSGNPDAWTWIFEGGNPSSSSERNPLVTYSQAGSYDVTLTVNNNDGSDDVTRTNIIVIYDEPIASFTTQINGNEVGFNNTSINGESYSWDFGNGESSNQENPQIIYNEPGTYFVRLTTFNECGSDQYVAEIVLVSPPTAAIMADQVDICRGQSVSFTDISIGEVTSRYWSFEEGNPASSEIESPVVQYLSAGTFDVSLNVSNDLGSDEVNLPNYIKVANSAVAEFSYEINGNQVNFINLSQYASSYSWDFGDGNGSTGDNPSHSYNEGGSYVVELVAGNQCSEDVQVGSIYIEVLPLAEFGIEGNGEICIESSVQFENRSSINVDSYFWEFEGGSPATSSDSNPLVHYNEPGNFNVSLTVANELGSDTKSTNNLITVFPNAEAGFTYQLNERLIQFTNHSRNAVGYLWDFGDGTTVEDFEPQHEYETDGTYEVKLTALSTCENDLYSEILEVKMAPVAKFEVENTEGCTGNIISVNNLSIGGDVTYEWVCESAVISDPLEESPTFIFNEPGTYEISLTVTNSSGSDTYTIEEAVLILDAVYSEVEYTIDGLNVFFSNNSSVGTHLWDFGDGNTSEEIKPEYTYGQEGIYQIVHTVVNVCGVDESLLELNLYSPPTAAFEVVNGVGCVPTEVQILNRSSINSETFTWISDGAVISGDDSNPLLSYETPGEYDITLIASNPGGEDTFSILNAVTVIDVVDPSFTYSPQLLAVYFEAAEIEEAEYDWDFGDGNEGVGDHVNHIYSDAGTYEVHLQVTNQCGSTSYSQEVVVNELPSAGFIVDNDSLCVGNSVQFFNQSSENSMEYQWMFEGGSPESSSIPDPMVTYSDTGTYDVTLIVTGIEGSDTLERKDFMVITGSPELIYNVSVEGNMIAVENVSQDYSYAAFILGNDTIRGTRIDYAASYNGTFTIVLMAENDCGTSTDTILTAIDVFPEATLNLERINGCSGTDITFPEREAKEGDMYHWYVMGKDSTYTYDGIEPVFNIIEEGIYDVKLIVENQYGMDSIKLQELIHINGIAPAEIQYDIEGNHLVAADVNGGEYSRLWEMGDGTQLDGISIEHTYENDGIYLMVYTTDNECGRDTVSVELEIISSSVIESHFNSLKIYPNPTSDMIFIENEGVVKELNIQLIDIQGKILRDFKLNERLLINSLDMNDIPMGIYLLQISDGIKMDHRKIIVVR